MGNAIVERQRQIGCKSFDFGTGTFTYTNPVAGNGIPKQVKTAAAESATVAIPIPTERMDSQFGQRIKQIKIPYRCTTANLTAVPTAVLYQENLGNPTAGTTSNITTTNIPVTTDATASTIVADAADRLLTVTVTTQAFESLTGAVPNLYYYLVVTFPAATTSVLTLYDATIIFDVTEY